jgi:hypothetical protein
VVVVLTSLAVVLARPPAWRTALVVLRRAALLPPGRDRPVPAPPLPASSFPTSSARAASAGAPALLEGLAAIFVREAGAAARPTDLDERVAADPEVVEALDDVVAEARAAGRSSQATWTGGRVAEGFHWTPLSLMHSTPIRRPLRLTGSSTVRGPTVRAADMFSETAWSALAMAVLRFSCAARWSREGSLESVNAEGSPGARDTDPRCPASNRAIAHATTRANTHISTRGGNEPPLPLTTSALVPCVDPVRQ